MPNPMLYIIKTIIVGVKRRERPFLEAPNMTHPYEKFNTIKQIFCIHECGNLKLLC
jgi:hypothetical protein